MILAPGNGGPAVTCTAQPDLVFCGAAWRSLAGVDWERASMIGRHSLDAADSMLRRMAPAWRLAPRGPRIKSLFKPPLVRYGVWRVSRTFAPSMQLPSPVPLFAAADGGHDVVLHLAGVDYLILGLYFVFVIAIGWILRKYLKTSADFFESGRSLPAWVCALGFIGANLGAQEVIGMAASGAKYGIMTSHFYWVGAIPAMVFVGVFMMPFYYGSKARSVPEYLKLRFDEKTRAFNALSFAFMTVFSSGISMHALALLLNRSCTWITIYASSVSSLIVLIYIVTGGLTSAIYNEVLQFFLIVLGLLPLVLLGLKDVGGWNGLMAQLQGYSAAQGMPRRAGRIRGPTWAARRPTRWASSGSAWSWASASCCRSATGARIFWSCSAPWRPRTCRPRAARRSSRRSRRCCFPRW